MKELDRVCTSCEELKPLSDFSKQKSGKHGRKAKCRDCCNEISKQYKLNNKDKITAQRKEYRRLNSEKIKEYNAQYLEKNIEELKELWSSYYLKNKSRINERHRKYYGNNRYKFRAYDAKRRSSKLNATPDWLTGEDLDEIADLYLAAKMFKLYTGQDYHVDHIVPLHGDTVCGLHVPWNLQILTAADNLSKNNKHKEDSWL